jgi:hypothetical protein
LNSLCFSNKKIFTETIEDKGRIINPKVLFDHLTGSQSPHEQCGLFRASRRQELYEVEVYEMKLDLKLASKYR